MNNSSNTEKQSNAQKEVAISSYTPNKGVLKPSTTKVKPSTPKSGQP